MNSLVLLFGGIFVFLVAYIVYGGFLAKKWGLSDAPTPAHSKRDDIDYVPADVKVILGHHFSSIAGAGPITGPILASVFGWFPVYLWILVGSVFIGGVHDFGSLVASLRTEGKGIGEIIKENISPRAKSIFNWYAWLTITLVVAAFTDICAATFAFDPAKPELLTGAQAGTASVLFIFLAIAFGLMVYRKNAPLAVASVAGVALLAFCIWFGYAFPILKFNKLTWQIILMVYITAASIMPVWLLLQPRDYLCSFLLYAMMIGAFLGIIIRHPVIEQPAFTGFVVKNQTLFPFLFVTVACGAISGFHSLISSGTTSKQINREKPDAQIIGYGSMLIEGLLAIIAIIAVGYVAKAQGSPAQIFANGVAWFMSGFGVPESVGKVFIILAYSAFALTSLDTATRIGRYLMQEIASGSKGSNNEKKRANPFSNIYLATAATIAVSVAFLVYGYQKIWPIFGSANQLLAALALLAVTAWVVKKGKKSWETIVPLVFMFSVTLTALFFIIRNNLVTEKPNYLLAFMGAVLTFLAILQIVEGVRVLILKKQNKN
ncbi:carbon starvation protein A [Treponema zuelzerae]|uniref:Carbon starvation protein A n=1 Tax=Teretinema zuelzerae TaxID=156 RepID=A0AAE3EG86_9SPIR|nr:carbon starvation protein A [Teretinema zuelzerae]MCD1654099.1 carbon starvation protein A [Teretinema zuelzerae]